MLYQPTGPSKEREMIDTGAGSERLGGRRFWRHAGGLGLIGVIVALALGAAFMSIGHDQRPRMLPMAAVGTAATARAVEDQAPGQFSVRAVPDRAAARQAIAERDVYGAVVLSGQRVRELLVASAANNGVANFLRRTFGEPTADGAPRITDVRPLPEDDATGIDISLLLQVLLIGGTIAVVGIGRLLPRFQGDPRILGAQISGAGTAPDFLPSFWSDLGQALPGGAGTSLLRDVFYFPEASTGGPIGPQCLTPASPRIRGGVGSRRACRCRRASAPSAPDRAVRLGTLGLFDHASLGECE